MGTAARNPPLGFLDLPPELRLIVYEFAAPEYNWRFQIQPGALSALTPIERAPCTAVSAFKDAHPTISCEYSKLIDRRKGELVFVVKPVKWDGPGRLVWPLSKVGSIFVWIDHYDLRNLALYDHDPDHYLSDSYFEHLNKELHEMCFNLKRFMELLKKSYGTDQPLPPITVAFKDVSGTSNADDVDGHWAQVWKSSFFDNPRNSSVFGTQNRM